MVLKRSFCYDRCKISINFLESVKLFVARLHICLGSFFDWTMTQIPYFQRRILFFVFYICENPYLLLCLGHTPADERPDANFQVLLLHLMMHDVYTVCKDFGMGFTEYISSRKPGTAQQLSVIFQKNSLSNYPYFHQPGSIFFILNFWSFAIYFLLVKKSIFNEKGIANETEYKSIGRN